MGFLQKIGGRKFLMSMLTLGAAIFIELNTARGLSPTMAAFLGGLVSAFAMTNAAIEKMYANKGQPKAKQSDENVIRKMEELIELTKKTNDPQTVQALTELLQTFGKGIADIKVGTGQIGAALANLQSEIRALRSGQ